MILAATNTGRILLLDSTSLEEKASLSLAAEGTLTLQRVFLFASSDCTFASNPSVATLVMASFDESEHLNVHVASLSSNDDLSSISQFKLSHKRSTIADISCSSSGCFSVLCESSLTRLKLCIDMTSQARTTIGDHTSSRPVAHPNCALYLDLLSWQISPPTMSRSPPSPRNTSSSQLYHLRHRHPPFKSRSGTSNTLSSFIRTPPPSLLHYLPPLQLSDSYLLPEAKRFYHFLLRAVHLASSSSLILFLNNQRSPWQLERAH